MTPDPVYDLPNLFVLVEGEPVLLWDNGDVEFYCDGDVRLSLAELKQIVRLADRFMYEREKRIDG